MNFNLLAAAGEFTRIYEELKGARVTSPLWAVAMEVIAARQEKSSGNGNPSYA